MKKIEFSSRHPLNNLRKENEPSPAKDLMPKWFLKHDKYKKDIEGNLASCKGEKIGSWKTCPALLDTLVSGYLFKTPCDVLITRVNGSPQIIFEKNFEDFGGTRGEEVGFPTPAGYDNVHFFWQMNWMPKVPKGYTTLVVHPINRFDLPFLTISGFIDCDDFAYAGKLPFFIKKDFEGFIPAGTPFAQVIPFYQEEWKHETFYFSEQELRKMWEKQQEEIFDSAVRTNYKQKNWIRKKYE